MIALVSVPAARTFLTLIRFAPHNFLQRCSYVV